MLSMISYTASAAQQNFGITFPYLDRDHLAVYVNGVEIEEFTFNSSTVIRLDDAADAGDIVLIRRQTPRDEPVVDYTNGANLGESDLDAGVLQNLFILQEILEAPAEEAPSGHTLDSHTDALPGQSTAKGTMRVYNNAGKWAELEAPETGAVLIGDTVVPEGVRWLPVGNDGENLEVDEEAGGGVSWKAGLRQLLIVAGDILYAAAEGVAARLAIGNEDDVLVAHPGDEPPLAWENLAAKTETLTNKTLTSPTINGGTISGASISGGSFAPTTITMPSASVGTGALKTATGSATCNSSATQTGGPGTIDADSVDVVGNDYQFAPSHTYATTLNTPGASVTFTAGDQVSNLADPGTTVYRRTIFTGVDASLAGGGEGGTSTYTLRWRYMTASDNPHIWMLVDQETGEVVATWFSDDPPSDGSPGLLYTKPELRKRFQSIQLTSADLESWSKLSPHADAAQQYIKDSKLRMQHAPMRALQLMANDQAPARWLADYCRFSTESQKVVVAAKSRADYQIDKGRAAKEKMKP